MCAGANVGQDEREGLAPCPTSSWAPCPTSSWRLAPFQLGGAASTLGSVHAAAAGDAAPATKLPPDGSGGEAAAAALLPPGAASELDDQALKRQRTG